MSNVASSEEMEKGRGAADGAGCGRIENVELSFVSVRGWFDAMQDGVAEQQGKPNAVVWMEGQGTG